jgi:hypothetical protein
VNLTTAIDAFFASQSGQLALWVVLLPVLDFVLGTLAAVRDGTFELDRVAAFLRKHVAGRILPLWLLLFVGYFTETWELPVLDVPALTTIGTSAAGLYVLETAGSILRSWGPTTGPALVTRDPVQPTPDE